MSTSFGGKAKDDIKLRVFGHYEKQSIETNNCTIHQFALNSNIVEKQKNYSLLLYLIFKTCIEEASVV